MKIRLADHKNTITIFIVSVMTAIFVVALQYVSSKVIKSDDASAILEIIDSEGIRGHIVQVEKTGIENIKSDDMLTKIEREEFDKYGYVRKQNHYQPGVSSAIAFAIETLLVDLERYEVDEMSVLEMRSSIETDASWYSLKYIVEGHPTFVRICNVTSSGRSCEIRLRDGNGSITDNALLARLDMPNKTGSINLELPNVATNRQRTTTNQNAILEMFVEPL